MKLTCTGADLHRAASWTAKIAPSNPTTPVMAGVLLDAGETLTLSATDYETFGTAECAAMIQDQGRVVVSARLLAAVAKAITPSTAEITLVSDGSRLEIRHGRSRWALPEMAADLWPTFPSVGEPIGKVDGVVLNRALSRVLPAAGKPDIEPPIFAGVRLTCSNNLRLEASDRYRIATADTAFVPLKFVKEKDGEENAQPLTETIVVPATVLKHAATGGEVEISAEGGTVGIRSGGFTILGRLLAGQFPREFDGYAATVREKVKTTAVMSVQELRSAVDGVVVVLGTEAHVLLGFAEDGVSVSPVADKKSDDDGEADAQADLNQFDGSDITIRVKHVVIADALHCLDSPAVKLSFAASPNKPLMLEPVGEDGEVLGDYNHILVPIVQKGK